MPRRKFGFATLDLDVPEGEALGRLSLFEGLSPAELAQVRPLLRAQRVPPDTLLMTTERPCGCVYLLLHGVVKIYVVEPEDHLVILGLRGAGEVLGEMSALDGQPHSANVLTLSPCDLLCMEQTTFCALAQTLPLTLRNLQRVAARRTRWNTTQICALSAHHAEERLHDQIAALAGAYGVREDDQKILIPLRLTQSDWAALTGLSRSRVNQVFCLWKHRGVIEIDDDCQLTILNETALQQQR